MVSLDTIEFHSEEEPYKKFLDSYRKKTGLYYTIFCHKYSDPL